MAGGLISPEYVSLTSDLGVLGSLATGYLSVEKVESDLSKITTTKPYQVNIFVDYEEYENKTIRKPKRIIEIEKSLGIHTSQSFVMPTSIDPLELIELAAKYGACAVSTTFGLLNERALDLIKTRKLKLMTTVNSIDEAEMALKDQKSDVIVWQNSLAGGHKGGFWDEPYCESSELFKLKDADYTDSFIIKAGGIVSGADVASALSEGFDGVQVGTGFLVTNEAPVPMFYKNELISLSDVSELSVTRSITGKSARGIKNELTEVEHESDDIVKYPFLHYATKDLRAYSKSVDLKAYQSLWAGTGAIKLKHKLDTRSYIEELLSFI